MVSDEQLIEDLCSFANEIGEVPTQRKMQHSGPWASKTYHNHFGSWNNALRKAGLEINNEHGISSDQLIEDLKEFSQELGEVPTASDMKDFGPWSASVYKRCFGSWNDALKKAGLETNLDTNISSEQLIKDLKEFSQKCGEVPTEKRMVEFGPRSAGVYKKRFGSWNNALKKAGLGTNYEYETPSSDQLVEDLKEFSEKLNKTPTASDMVESGPWSIMTYYNHFGSWNNALKKAELEINRLSTDEISGVGEYSYGIGWCSARSKTLERDGQKCRICESSKRPNVHHIKPRRKFENVSDSNTLDNLITLCPTCHGTFEGRWQDADPDEFEKKAKELYRQRA